MNSFWRSLPNLLTISRLVLIPVFVWLMTDPTEQRVLAAAVVFVVASLTDLFDGYFARKWKVVSELGKLLDPLADKILVMAALVMLVAQRSDLTGDPWIPGWIVVLILAREIWVTGLRGIAASRGVIVAAASSGKLKSFLQMTAILFLLFHGQSIALLDYAAGRVIPCQLIGIGLILLSILFSYVGAIDYTWAVMCEGRDSSSVGSDRAGSNAKVGL